MAVPHCFQLIHALSATEKRTLSVYARMHVIGGETRYLRLFEIIEAMPDYHESALRQQMLSVGLPVKWVKADLNYLYN